MSRKKLFCISARGKKAARCNYFCVFFFFEIFKIETKESSSKGTSFIFISFGLGCKENKIDPKRGKWVCVVGGWGAWYGMGIRRKGRLRKCV